MNPIITKLQDKTKVKAFGLMEPEERECLEIVGPRNCLILCQLEAGPRSCGWEENKMNSFSGYRTYVIKPDYKLEPEYVDVEISVHTPLGKSRAWVGCWYDESFFIIGDVTGLPNFVGFYIKDEEYFINLIAVARTIRDGKKVHARFRRD